MFYLYREDTRDIILAALPLPCRQNGVPLLASMYLKAKNVQAVFT